MYCLTDLPTQAKPSSLSFSEKEAATELKPRVEHVHHLEAEVRLHALHAEGQVSEYLQTTASLR